MERITIETRTLKGKPIGSEVKIRFRIRDGRDVQIFYKSGLVASVRDLSKFEIDGTLKRKVAAYNNELYSDIQGEIKAIHEAYAFLSNGGYVLNSETLAKEVDKVKNPDKEARKTAPSLLERYKEFVDERYQEGSATKASYNIVSGLLERFLIINGILDIKPMDFTASQLMALHTFCKEEYKYVNSWGRVYVKLTENNIPTAPRSDNTVATRMKRLKCFFSALEDNDEIVKSPFRKIGQEKRKEFCHESYDNEIIALSLEELESVKNAELPDSLIVARDAFLLQCYIGVRISDYKSFTMDNVRTSEDGFAFLSYVPIKTQHHKIEVTTPLTKSAYELVTKYQMDFAILNYAGGKDGYNKKIQRILKASGIDRKVKVWNEETKRFDLVPLADLATSKVGRKTCVTLCAKNSVNEYASGLHSGDSKSVQHYHDITLQERYGVFCRAFGEINEPYINN